MPAVSVTLVAARIIRLLEDVCSRHSFSACGRLEEIKVKADAAPAGLLLTALLGVIDGIVEEARSRGLDDVVELVEDARRDVEWMLREALD